MDRRERTLNVVKALNNFNNNIIAPYKFLDEVCDFFDFIKDQELDDADKNFLVYLSNRAGVPQYFDILDKFNSNQNSINEENINLNTISSLLYESTLYTDKESKLHKYQKDVLDLFQQGKENRFFLSASTSFGKTHLVYEVIKKMQYKNIALIFPSIALLTENLSKIKEGKVFFPIEYKIHTLSDINNEYGENNIFIFTPERFLSFLDKTDRNFSLDFVFVDEVYKIDNGYIIDNESKENERDVAYRMAIFYGLTRFPDIDLLLAGPYIEVFTEQKEGYNPSFDLFLKDFNIDKLILNNYEIVKVNKTSIQNVNGNVEIDGIYFDFTKKYTHKDRIQEIIDKILLKEENVIIYCNSQANAEKIARDYDRGQIRTQHFQDFINHLKAKYNNDWIVIKALEKGIGVHHGVVPKYIQKEIIDLFNLKGNEVNVLVSTTTITEGVNTTAKNMVVYKSEKGSGKNAKPLLTFDAKNIAGRAGRFMEHYKGRVISLEKRFIDKINEEGQQITYKNYDRNAEKKEIDDEMTPPQYLDDRAKARIQEIKELQQEREIPDSIISQFKVISRRDKIKVYDKIRGLSPIHHQYIDRLIEVLNYNPIRLDKNGFQVILDLLYEVIENENLKALIENKFNDNFSNNRYSIIFASLNSYLNNGFIGIFSYYLKDEQRKGNGNAVNTAMRKASMIIFNTFKYQLVKYLGVFNLMYRFWMSQLKRISYEETSGIDRLLIKLEYNAFSEEARTASDYGVPENIIRYYDANSVREKKNILNSFDNYENHIFNKIRPIIEE